MYFRYTKIVKLGMPGTLFLPRSIPTSSGEYLVRRLRSVEFVHKKYYAVKTNSIKTAEHKKSRIALCRHGISRRQMQYNKCYSSSPVSWADNQSYFWELWNGIENRTRAKYKYFANTQRNPDKQRQTIYVKNKSNKRFLHRHLGMPTLSTEGPVSLTRIRDRWKAELPQVKNITSC